MDKGKVSIIIPTFNCDVFVEETLRSVSAQKYTNWECIIVDDGSTDSTVAVIQQYIINDNRFSFFNRSDFNNRKGGNVCRNIGIKKAIGFFLIFLDGDDVLHSFCLEQRVKYFEDYPDHDFLVFQMIRFNKDGEIEGSELTRNSNNYLYDYLSYNVPWQTTCAIIHTGFVHSFLREFDEDFPRLQDPEFYTRALLVDDVKFKVLYDLPADAMYRTFEGKKFNHVNSLFSFSLYIKKFYPLVCIREDREEAIASLKTMYNHVSYKYLAHLHGKEAFKIMGALWSFHISAKSIGLIGFSSFFVNSLRVAYIMFKNGVRSVLTKVKRILSK